MNLAPLNRDSEIRLIKKLTDIEIGLYKVKSSLIQWGIFLILILTGSEAFIYKLFH